MLCSLCNAQNSDTAMFCHVCGGPLVSGAAGGSPGATSGSLPAGTKLQSGAFTLGRVLGQGGFGITYLGSDVHLGRAVAVKEFFPLSAVLRQNLLVQPTGTMSAHDYALARDKFLDEARVLALFNHPGIVNVFTSFQENNTAYMVMEFVRGQTLQRLIENRRYLPEAEAVGYIEKVGQALEVVHGAGLLHRDIKPENIMVCDAAPAEPSRVVLVDFGTAREFAAGQTRRMTAMLTIGYAPLEQYTQSAKFGAPTDVYALGATLYHALTGECPVPATDRATGVPLSPPHQMRMDGHVISISRTVSEAVMWALGISVNDRPQTMRDFLLALRSTKTSPRGVPPPAAPGQNPHLPRMRQIIGEMAAPLTMPPSPHDARLQQIAARLAPLRTHTPLVDGQCPACRRPALVHHAQRAAGVQECPLCRTGRLIQRQIDESLCPICRSGKLEEHDIGAHGLFCPLCKVSPLKEDRRRRFGLPLDLWLTCPTCKAAWDVQSGATAKLMTPGNTALGAQSLHQVRPVAEWKRLSGRADRVLRCPSCAAQFDAPTDDRVKLAYCRTDDPYEVAHSYMGKTFFRRAWARLAQGLPLGAGDFACSGCASEWNFDNPTQTLKLLHADSKYAWAQSWQGKSVPVPAWYLAAAGKQSLQPGWLCTNCRTEFDDSGAQHKLIRTTAGPLSSLIGRTHPLEDWYRAALSLPPSTEEHSLHDETARLQSSKQRDQAQLQQAHDQKRKRLEEELATLLKQSCLEGFIKLGVGTSTLSLKDGEVLRWKSSAQMFRQRTHEHQPYWDLDKRGTLMVTNHRILLEDSPYAEPWSRTVAKLRSVDLDYHGGQPLLALHFRGLKKPFGFVASEMQINASVDNHIRLVTLTAQDLKSLLRQLAG